MQQARAKEVWLKIVVGNYYHQAPDQAPLVASITTPTQRLRLHTKTEPHLDGACTPPATALTLKDPSQVRMKNRERRLTSSASMSKGRGASRLMNRMGADLEQQQEYRA